MISLDTGGQPYINKAEHNLGGEVHRNHRKLELKANTVAAKCSHGNRPTEHLSRSGQAASSPAPRAARPHQAPGTETQGRAVASVSSCGWPLNRAECGAEGLEIQGEQSTAKIHSNYELSLQSYALCVIKF